MPPNLFVGDRLSSHLAQLLTPQPRTSKGSPFRTPFLARWSQFIDGAYVREKHVSNTRHLYVSKGQITHTHTRVRVPTCLPRGKGIYPLLRATSSCPAPPPCHSSHHLRRLRKKRERGPQSTTYGATKQSKAKKMLMGVSHVSSGSLGTPSPGSPANHPRIPHTTTRPGAWNADHRGTRVRVHPCRAPSSTSARVQCAPPPLPGRLHVLRDAGQATARRSGHQGRYAVDGHDIAHA